MDIPSIWKDHFTLARPGCAKYAVGNRHRYTLGELQIIEANQLGYQYYFAARKRANFGDGLTYVIKITSKRRCSPR